MTRSDNSAATFGGWGDMFERVPFTNGVEVHHDLGVDLNYQAYMSGNPVAGGPGSAPSDADTVEVAGGPYVPEEFQRRVPPEGDGEGDDQSSGKGGAPGGPPPEFSAGSNVGGASAGMAIH